MAISHNGRRLQSLSHPPTPPPPPETPQPTPSVWTPMSRQWRCSMKNALARTLSHPPHPPTPPPEPPPTNTQRMNTYVTSMKMFHEERTSKNVITPLPSLHPWPLFLVAEKVLFWLLTRSFLGCWLGRSWLLTRSFLVADSDVLGCWLGQLLTRLL